MMDPVVLIVDNNEDNRFTLSMRLEACGYEKILTAENGREALDMAATQTFTPIGRSGSPSTWCRPASWARGNSSSTYGAIR
jgi:CheY-like chemotaxis protein